MLRRGRRATVVSVNGSVVRTSSAAARMWRMRQWPNDATVAHLIFVDHQTVPTPQAVEAAVEHAWAKGARAIRTSALFPASAEVVVAGGFTPIDRLALLQVHLDQATMRRLGEPVHRTRSMLPWSHHVAAGVDQRAFGPLWGNDSSSLRDIRTATPAHRGRMVRIGRRLAGFALSGAAADIGYLQRIAVDPEHRRAGIARDLCIDALTWMHSDHRARCLVNTGVDNHAALALYDGLGFSHLPDVLTIAERRAPE